MAASAAFMEAVLWIYIILVVPAEVSAVDETRLQILKPVDAWSSSTQPVPSLIDGNNKTIVAESNAYTIDLGGVHSINHLELVSDPRDSQYIIVKVSEEQDGEQRPCWSGYDTVKPRVGCAQVGRFVTLQGYGILKLYEVKVYECKSGYFGKHCNKECHCFDGIPCRKTNGRCPGLKCAPGWHDKRCSTPCRDGTFGVGCQRRCYCDGKPCNKETGYCEQCAMTFIGDTCEISIPSLKYHIPRKVAGKSTSSIRLSWISPVEPTPEDLSANFSYTLEYRKYGTKDSWKEGAILPHNASKQQQQGEVDNLTMNTFYEFRVVPQVEIIDHGNRDMFIGTPSQHSVPLRTACKHPDQPVMKNLTTTIDEEEDSAKAVKIVVSWTKLNRERSGCENLHYYQIRWEEVGTGNFSIQFVGNKTDKFEMKGLKYSTPYKVQVIAYNNRNLKSVPQEQDIVTLPEEYHLGLKRRQSQEAYGAGRMKPHDKSTPIVAGIVIAMILIVAVIAAYVFYRRRRSGKYSNVPHKMEQEPVEPAKFTKINIPENESLLDSGVVDASTSDNTPSSAIDASASDNTPSSTVDVVEEVPKEPPPPPVSHVIQVDQLEEYVLRGKKNDSKALRREYEELPMGFTTSCEHGKKIENKHKNRFVNIVAYDHSRVILDLAPGDPDSDYINANYIEGYKNTRNFIAAQGCNKYTVQDMWRLVWQVNTGRIIMATNLVENGKRKCEQYWPEEGEKQYGDITVRLMEVEQTADYVIRTFNLTKEEETRNVKQLHFTAWPDHGVPSQAVPILAFRRKVHSYDQSHPGPVVVHCSAGVGRTGTYIAIDQLLEQAKEESQIDLYSFTQNMRKNRVNMIQTVEQYIFVYDALLEALKHGDSAIPLTQFEQTYKEMKQTDKECEINKLEKQFKSLQQMSPGVVQEHCRDGRLVENLQKNRSTSLIPADHFRPFLRTPVEGTNDYISAVFVDGYRSRNGYILTQMPLPTTVIDLWRMVYDHHVATIVMLNPMDYDDETYGQYWDDDSASECGPFTIEHVSTDTSNPVVTVRKMKVTYQPEYSSALVKKEPPARMVCQFQFNAWTRDGAVPETKTAILSLLDLVEGWQYQSGYSPIVVHCHDGGEACGLFTAASCMFEKLKVELEVDAFQTVKQLRRHRNQVVTTKEEYEYLFELVLEFLKEFETYSNFR